MRSTNPVRTGAGIDGSLGELLERGEVVAHELGTQDEVLRRIAGDGELGKADEVGAAIGRPLRALDHRSTLPSRSPTVVLICPSAMRTTGTAYACRAYSIPPMSTL